MKLEKQVCSLDLAKRLKELGVKQESLFWWVNQPNGGLQTNGYKWQLEPEPRTRHQSYDYLSAFTVAELGEMLAESINTADGHFHLHISKGTRAVGHWTIGYANYETSLKAGLIDEQSEADARAKMLIYLLQNKIMDTE